MSRPDKRAADRAQAIADLLENQCPDIRRVRMVLENPNTHAVAALGAIRFAELTRSRQG